MQSYWLFDNEYQICKIDKHTSVDKKYLLCSSHDGGLKNK